MWKIRSFVLYSGRSVGIRFAVPTTTTANLTDYTIVVFVFLNFILLWFFLEDSLSIFRLFYRLSAVAEWDVVPYPARDSASGLRQRTIPLESHLFLFYNKAPDYFGGFNLFVFTKHQFQDYQLVGQLVLVGLLLLVLEVLVDLSLVVLVGLLAEVVLALVPVSELV